MATTAPMFLELEQEEREKELEQLEQQLKEQENQDSGPKQSPDSTDNTVLRQQRGKRILLAAEKGRLVELVRMLHEDHELVNYADSDGYTPLHRACYSGHIDCVKYLCKHGADIEARTTDDWRPLHCAVRWNNVEAAQYLIEQGADINAKSVGGNTPLHIAASNGRYSLTCDIIQMLLYHPDCDYLVKNQSGDSAFDLAKRGSPLYRLWVGVTTITLDDKIELEE